jgi:hypothetical protein
MWQSDIREDADEANIGFRARPIPGFDFTLCAVLRRPAGIEREPTESSKRDLLWLGSRRCANELRRPHN